MINLKSSIILLFCLFTFISCVDKSKFKTCSQSGFCKRLRDIKDKYEDEQRIKII